MFSIQSMNFRLVCMCVCVCVGGSFWPHHLFLTSFFGIPFHTSISQPSRKFQPKVFLSQLRWPYLKNVYGCTVTTVFKLSVWNFQELINTSVLTKSIPISEFRFRWPEVRSVLRPVRYKRMGKCSNAVFFESASENALSIPRHSYNRALSMIHSQFRLNDLYS